MPVIKCPGGKFRIGKGRCMYRSRASAERAYRGYLAHKYSEDLDGWGLPVEEAREFDSEKLSELGDLIVRVVDETWDGDLGNAAWVEGGFIQGYHVTDDVDSLRNHLMAGHAISYKGSHVDDLGHGLYVSGVPEYWMVRSTGKWEFLNRLTVDQFAAIENYILPILKDHLDTHYITKSEYDAALRHVSRIRENPDLLTILAGQPYNILIWDPKILKGLGIDPSRQPEKVLIKLRGNFAELNRNPVRSEIIKMKAAGLDGAFTRGGFSTSPQLVAWTKRSIVSVGE